MRILHARAYPRAGLVGNPSDGYHGKTISVSLRNFHAEVVLYEWDTVEILSRHQDRTRFGSVTELCRDVELHGYYGGERLVKAAIKRFVEFCDRRKWPLSGQNFSIRYETNIPRNVGLAGSSAIIVATLRALSEYYRVEIPREVLPSLALSVERDELHIPAGLQDRVVQVYEGLVYMDFSEAATTWHDGLECGMYEPLSPSHLPPLYVAYSQDLGEPTEVFHNDLRERFRSGDPRVLEAMRQFALLTEAGRAAILAGDAGELGRIMNANFDLRQSICRLNPRHVAMVNAARATGASAKFAGSGGAIVGVCDDEQMFHKLQERLAPLRCTVLRAQIGPETDEKSAIPEV
ncbi:MAG: mevalonate kinase [Planctomycetales bacterium]